MNIFISRIHLNSTFSQFSSLVLCNFKDTSTRAGVLLNTDACSAHSSGVGSRREAAKGHMWRERRKEPRAELAERSGGGLRICQGGHRGSQVFKLGTFEFSFPDLLPISYTLNYLKSSCFSWLHLFSCSVQFSHSIMSNSLRSHGLQHARPPCPSPTPGVYSNSCPLSQWWHPTISSSVTPFSSCLQSFPASGSLQMSQPFISGDQSIGISASTSILPMNTQDWSPLGWTGWLSLHPRDFLGFPGDTSGKEPTCQYRRPKKLWFNPWVRKTPLEEGMATHFSILAWRILCTEEPGGLRSIGS